MELELPHVVAVHLACLQGTVETPGQAPCANYQAEISFSNGKIFRKQVSVVADEVEDVTVMRLLANTIAGARQAMQRQTSQKESNA